ncbi:hypothetical protein RRG08_048631 [Elysia crispata]|uniref:Uncharacterized protein n=1 Tax=Elysia crispata TaxID=231223 RepID=A0AAE1AD95_9GAST|nr:hypothetical protein RRG08_048631 [Elysia crispata]
MEEGVKRHAETSCPPTCPNISLWSSNGPQPVHTADNYRPHTESLGLTLSGRRVGVSRAYPSRRALANCWSSDRGVSSMFRGRDVLCNGEFI